ncbi:hypothetical protein G4177_06600 [Corallococcus sp. ZKHCc1 1396]|uniref:Uncharacterized protein n=1 Tax=Corallococcus soli TaxID=2710757 RepID=A0ABR9PIU5_9BACT|nr:hypothetical protein [Corallococcus soli]MBE4747848.1 hypothetical protein [Corallococcus soli]
MPRKIGGGSSFKAPSLSPPPAASSSKPRNTVTTAPPTASTSGQKRPADAVDGAASASGPNKKPKVDGGTSQEADTTENRAKRQFLRGQRRQESTSAVAASGGRSEFVNLQRLDPKAAGKQRVETGFGPTNASRFPTKDPGFKITTEAKDYGKQKVGHTYTELVAAMKEGGASDKAIAKDLLKKLEDPDSTPAVLTGDKAKNAAAKLTTIMHVSEPQRVPGSDKTGRAVLRMVEKGDLTLEQAFTGSNPTFPMAKNPKTMRRVVNYDDTNFRKPPEKPLKFDEIAANMSDSSDDEI